MKPLEQKRRNPQNSTDETIMREKKKALELNRRNHQNRKEKKTIEENKRNY